MDSLLDKSSSSGSRSSPISSDNASGMLSSSATTNSSTDGSDPKTTPSLPTVSLPIGGGALRGMSEHFDVNPAKGTGSLSIPVPTSANRSGFSPNISLAYDSSAGNGSFGLGWSLSLPEITLKTDDGVPRYRDNFNSFNGQIKDEIRMSGLDDLVPCLLPDNTSASPSWTSPKVIPRIIDGVSYKVWAFRPRVESSFARCELWVRSDTGETQWRATTGDNVTTTYGKDAQSRVSDPNDPAHVFSWLISERYDDKGNIMIYQYKPEDSTQVDILQNNERNRTPLGRSAQRYVKSIKYGNDVSYRLQKDLSQTKWMFEIIFDYGEHDPMNPSPTDDGAWLCRNDAFSSHKSGFELRSYRLCQRILMFHHFSNEPKIGNNCLVSSTTFKYRSNRNITDDERHGNPFASFLASIMIAGFTRNDQGGYISQVRPPMEFEYGERIISDAIREIDEASLKNLPVGVDGRSYSFVDLDGEGISGVLSEQAGSWYYKANDGNVHFGPTNTVARIPSIADLSGDEMFSWYQSLADDGFAPAELLATSLSEEKGPRLVFADGVRSVYVSDMSGDGLADLVRVTNGEVCYWPSLGYGQFGLKVTMDNSPWFDASDLFDQDLIRLADIDGSGSTDIIYLGSEEIRVFFNQSGNHWAEAIILPSLPRYDCTVNVATVDLFGNGTSCLVWSSPKDLDSRIPMRYIDFMGGQKPHLLTTWRNNLGKETRLQYTPSTQFYLADKRAGSPWVSRLPFPVQVVERIEDIDFISQNRLVSRFAFHHGYFDGKEREFRGFGLVEQWDTEEFSKEPVDLSNNLNFSQSSNAPPVLTKTWFHTGFWSEGQPISRQLEGTYFREAGLTNDQYQAMLVVDSQLPQSIVLADGSEAPYDLSADEKIEALRALEGQVLHREVFALDGTVNESIPYDVMDYNYSLQLFQPIGPNLHAVLFSHARESVSYTYERKLYAANGQMSPDPRVKHDININLDQYGNVLDAVSLMYGRRHEDPNTLLTATDREQQTKPVVSLMKNHYTNPVLEADDYRVPLLSEMETFELYKIAIGSGPPGIATKLTRYEDISGQVLSASDGLHDLPYEDLVGKGAIQNNPYRRPIERHQSLYRRNDFSGALPVGQLESLGLPYEDYKQAFTPGLVDHVYGQSNKIATNDVNDFFQNQARYVHRDTNTNWWEPSGQWFYSPDPAATPAQELSTAEVGFFLPLRFRNPFFTTTMDTDFTVEYDSYHMLIQETRDALGNRTTVGERAVDPTQPLVRHGQDYRTLQPAFVMDPNNNLSTVAYDSLGVVVGTAIMGKPNEAVGDSLEGFDENLTIAKMDIYFQDPLNASLGLLARATTRTIYDLSAYYNTKAQPHPNPVVTSTIMRETHFHDLVANQEPALQYSFSYMDGFSRAIQKKKRAEAGPAPKRDPATGQIIFVNGQPALSDIIVDRWIGSSWIVFNNKSQPVRQYEPFYTDTYHYELDTKVGASSVFFYDPLQRLVGTLHPNHTWSKTVFDSWGQESWDVCDTIMIDDPKIDEHLGNFFSRLPDDEYLPSWRSIRANGSLGPQEQKAAAKSAVFASTPKISHFDVQGRTILSVVQNRFQDNSQPTNPVIEESRITRTILDIEGNEIEVVDTADRTIIRRVFDMLGNTIYSASMDSGERWTLRDVAGKPRYTWDATGQRLSSTYDRLQRASETRLLDLTPSEVVVDRVVYGELSPNPEQQNLRLKTAQQQDQAGVLTSVAYDFKGNLLESQRRYAVEYRNILDLSQNIQLQTTNLMLTSKKTYDALNRPTTSLTPDKSITTFVYDKSGFLIRVNVQAATLTVPSPFIKNYSYDAKGQTVSASYGNGVAETYDYDPFTALIRHKVTKRDPTKFSGDSPNLPSTGLPKGQVQNLSYTYDPVGNVTSIQDDAQHTIFFRNTIVEPSNEYTYNALYELIEATGREHLGQAGGKPSPPTASNAFQTRKDHPNDGKAMGNYTERYAFDTVGNIKSVQHIGDGPNSGWTRTYTYSSASPFQPNKMSNRLTSTTIGGPTETYQYDGAAGVRGNVTSMPRLPLMNWNYLDQLHASAQQNVGNGGTPETTYYIYDNAGKRVRKVTETQASAGNTPKTKRERLYFDTYEDYKEYGANGATVILERQTLHIMGNNQRVAVVENQISGDPQGLPPMIVRFQFSNHLQSSCIELDDQGSIISYEEYFPYGSSSYQGVRLQTETPKRYRYNGKEKDEESGLYYYGARYYASWLGRWTSPDPAGLADGLNVYEYVGNNSVNMTDLRGLSRKWKKPEKPAKPEGEEGEEPETETGSEGEPEIRGGHDTEVKAGENKRQKLEKHEKGEATRKKGQDASREREEETKERVEARRAKAAEIQAAKDKKAAEAKEAAEQKAAEAAKPKLTGKERARQRWEEEQAAKKDPNPNPSNEQKSSSAPANGPPSSHSPSDPTPEAQTHVLPNPNGGSGTPIGLPPGKTASGIPSDTTTTKPSTPIDEEPHSSRWVAPVLILTGVVLVTVGVVGTAFLAADDVTGVGVLDDAALPVTVGAVVLGKYLVGKGKGAYDY